MKNTSLILSVISLVAVVVFGVLTLTGKNTASAEVTEGGEATEVAAKGDIVYIDLDRILIGDLKGDLTLRIGGLCPCANVHPLIGIRRAVGFFQRNG